MKNTDAFSRLVWMLLALGSLTGLAACGSASVSSTLWTTIQAQGPAIYLNIDSEHPRAKSLANIQLLLAADFLDETGQLRTASLGLGQRQSALSLAFRLPEQLNNVPKGEVCLYFSPVDPRLGPLPVRARSDQGDSSGFRYAAWEEGIRARTKQAVLTRQRVELEAQLAAQQRVVDRLQARLSSQGVSAAEQCDRPSDSKQLGSVRGTDVVGPAAQASSARRICLRRLRELSLVAPFNVIDELLAQKMTMSAERGKQSHRLAQDWRSLGAQTGPDYQPELGDVHETLAISTEAEVLMAKKERTQVQTQAMLAGVLDGYDTCVADTQRQLGHRYQLWLNAQSRSGDRAAAMSAFRASECRGMYQRLEVELANVAATAKALSGLDSSAPPGVPPSDVGHTVVLNAERCTATPRR